MPAEILIPSVMGVVLMLLIMLLGLRRRPRRSRRLVSASLEAPPEVRRETFPPPSARAPRSQPRPQWVVPKPIRAPQPAPESKSEPAELESDDHLVAETTEVSPADAEPEAEFPSVAAATPPKLDPEPLVVLPPIEEKHEPESKPRRRSRHELPDEVQQRLSMLNERLDQLERTIENLEGQLQDFDLKFDAPTSADADEQPTQAEEKTIAA